MLPHSPSYQMGFYPPVWLVVDVFSERTPTEVGVRHRRRLRGHRRGRAVRRLPPRLGREQPNWEYHESDLVDPEDGRIDTLPHWRRTASGVGLEASVIGVAGDPPSSQPAGTGRLPSALSTAGTRRSRPGPTTAAGRLTSPSVACSASTTCCRTQRTGAVPPMSSNVLRSSPPSSSTTTPPRAAPGAGHAGNPGLDGIHSAVVEWGAGAPLHYCVVETFASMSGRVGVVSGQPRGRWHGAAVARACPDGPQR